MHFFFFSMHTRVLVCGLVALHSLCVKSQSQTRCVIIDKETGVPIRDVKAYTDRGSLAVTDYRGIVVLDSAFESVTFSHVSYLTRVAKRAEVRDTLWLLPAENRLTEVVVWGEDRKGIKSLVESAKAAALASATPPPGGISFDFARLLEKKPLSRKARKRNAEILRNWDKEERKP